MSVEVIFQHPVHLNSCVLSITSSELMNSGWLDLIPRCLRDRIIFHSYHGHGCALNEKAANCGSFLTFLLPRKKHHQLSKKVWRIRLDCWCSKVRKAFYSDNWGERRWNDGSLDEKFTKVLLPTSCKRALYQPTQCFAATAKSTGYCKVYCKVDRLLQSLLQSLTFLA